MSRFIGLLLVVLSLLVAQGCAGPSLEEQPPYHSPPIVKKDAATICFYRLGNGLGSAVVTKIDIDGKVVGYLPDGGYFVTNVPAGGHEFAGRRANLLQGSFGDGNFQLTVEGGKVYFIEQQTRIIPFKDDGQSLTPTKSEVFRRGVKYYIRWALVPQSIAQERMLGGVFPGVRLAPGN